MEPTLPSGFWYLMQFAVPLWLDTLFITPFSWPVSPFIGFWLGCAILAAYCVLLGELVSGLLFLTNKKYYFSLQDKMAKFHNLSVTALQSGDKEAYKNINSLAHESFGKAFFAEATVGMTSILPVPFALGWLAIRFTDIPVVTIPFTGHAFGYPFVFLLLYIIERILFAVIKPRLPFFRHIHEVKTRAKEARGALRSFFSSVSSEQTKE